MKKAVHTSGKRKQAVARASVTQGKGDIRINGIPLDIYTPEFARNRIKEPLILAGELAGKVNAKVVMNGGGWQSQTEAARLALAKGLVEISGSKALKKTFLEYDRHLLIADVRRNEPHKPNDSKPRAKRQKSYR